MAADRVPTGRMIRAARALAGLEQKDLAEEAGVDRRTISRLEAETDEPSNPLRRETVVKVRDILQHRHRIVFLHTGRNHGEGVALKD